VIEAWGPDRAACLTEAMEALVAVYADFDDATATRSVPVSAEPVGPVPKAVSHHGLKMAEQAGIWRCRAVVDV
jgi:SHS2 domain-containing protein